MESFWIIDEIHESTNDTFDFLNAQIDALSKETNGDVLAKLIKKRTSSYASVQKALSELPERLQTVHEGSDATSLYGRVSYEFFVTDKNNRYELAIFEMTCNDEYPILLRIDRDIAEEAKLNTEYDVDSFEAFQGYYADMMKAPKIGYIIRKLRLLSMNNPES